MTQILPCLVLPLKNKNLLLPTSAIAEIIPYQEPKSIEDTPDWLLGILSWRGIHIPLTHLEEMESYFVWTGQNEKNGEEDKRKFYIAIINRIYKIEVQNQQVNQYPFFSIVLRSAPKLYRVSQDGIKMITPFKAGDGRFIMEVEVQNNDVLIPDLAGLWKMIDTLPSRLQWFRQIIL